MVFFEKPICWTPPGRAGKQSKSEENQELESKRLLSYLGLEWNDGCMSFYKSKRIVNTSTTEVRQPIYSHALQAWRKFENQLQPLAQTLQKPLG